MKYSKYYEAVKFLESLINLPALDYSHKSGDRSFYLKRLNWFLKLLGNPQNGIKYIHVTGTAGKGSAVHYLHEILLAAGKKVGSYYSPHPTTDIERIRVNNLLIAPNELVKITEQLKPALSQAAAKSPYGIPSYFETFLALAFIYFKKQQCEYVILEAGLGGTYDATNVIVNPRACCITNIDYDHQEILGRTLKKIARDKAGIIKKGTAFFTAETRPALLAIFKEKCAKLKVPCLAIATPLGENPNLLLAKNIAEYLKIPAVAITKGLKEKNLACRFEIMQERPKVIMDGSHNPSKLQFLTQKLNQLKGQKIIIFGMAQDKNLAESLKKIIPLTDYLLITRFLMPYRKSADLKTIQMEALKIKPSLKTKLFIDPWQALEYGLKTTTASDNLIITGSFFLAGLLRQRWINEETILKKRKSS